MKEEERRAVGELITSGIETLKTSIAEMEDAARPVSPDNAIGRLGRVDAMSGREISKSTLFAMKSKLSRLEHLSTKINEPDFGLCSRCGRQIPVKRLMAIPETNLCVQCAAG